MPLPELPPTYQQAAYESLVRHLPGRWFQQLETGSPLRPILWGVAGVLGYVRHAYDEAVRAAIPMLSEGVWLTLHLRGIGLDRSATESDESAKDRYQWEFRPTRNTRAGILSALSHFTGLEPPSVRLETDFAQGRYGEFRIVLGNKTQPWQSVQLNYVGNVVQRFVANGIIPSVDAELKCLLFQRLPVWQFSDQFPLSFNSLGPLWERPAFYSELRLPFARSLVAQVTAPEWRSSRDSLIQFYRDAIGNAPGAFFVYLSDEDNCPYLLADYNLGLETLDINQTFPPQPFEVDGWHFWDEFPIIGPSLLASLIAPFLEVPAGPIVNETTPLPLQELHEIFPNFPGDSQSLNSEVISYSGLDFTRLQITEFLTPDPANTGNGYTSPNLQLLRSGPWQLRLTEGDSRWGNFPPQGDTLVGTPFATLDPESIWWTDETAQARSFTPNWDGEAVYLAMEFILPKGEERTIRELELMLDGGRVEYRRFGLPVDEDINAGFVFKLKAVLNV